MLEILWWLFRVHPESGASRSSWSQQCWTAWPPPHSEWWSLWLSRTSRGSPNGSRSLSCQLWWMATFDNFIFTLLRGPLPLLVHPEWVSLDCAKVQWQRRAFSFDLRSCLELSCFYLAALALLVLKRSAINQRFGKIWEALTIQAEWCRLMAFKQNGLVLNTGISMLSAPWIVQYMK